MKLELERRATSVTAHETAAKRKVYSPPSVELLGGVHEAVMGGSPGLSDSGSPTTRQPPPGAVDGVPVPNRPRS